MNKLILNEGRLPAEIVRAAVDAIGRQPEVPLSPASVDARGGVHLCAAACLAKAGLERNFSHREADEFQRKLAASRSFALVREAFAKLGWSQDLCDSALKENDSSTLQYRKETVIRYFRSLAAR